MNRLQDLYRQIEAKAGEVNTIHEQIGDDAPTEEQFQRVVTLNKEIEDLEGEVKELAERKLQADQLKQAAADRLKAINMAIHPSRHGNPRDPESGASGSPGSDHDATRDALAKSLGAEFVESKMFKEWLAGVAINGRISEKSKIQSPPLQVREMLGGQAKALVTGGSVTSGGAAIIPGQYGGLVSLPFRPLVLRNLITVAQTGSDSVEYVRVTSYTNNAAPVAEATATAGTSGTKPESGMAMERVNEPVKTIAHWIPATTRALADAAQIRTLIDAFLREGLDQALETQMVTGDGVNENFLGVLNQPGLGAQAWDTNLLTTTRRARTKVMTQGRANATGYILNPMDWEDIDLTTEPGTGRYFFGGPSVLGTPRLWGLPVIESEAIPEGTGLVGDLRQMVLWDREQAAISVSNQHSDFFVRNLLAILAELRAAFGVLRPAAIIEIDLTAA